jgi:hypothetical protein
VYVLKLEIHPTADEFLCALVGHVILPRRVSFVHCACRPMRPSAPSRTRAHAYIERTYQGGHCENFIADQCGKCADSQAKKISLAAPRAGAREPFTTRSEGASLGYVVRRARGHRGETRDRPIAATLTNFYVGSSGIGETDQEEAIAGAHATILPCQP